MKTVTSEDHRRIADAIAAAESRTAGEIYCVLARRAGDYREAPLGWAVAIALIAPMALIPLGYLPVDLPFLGGGWSAAHSSATDHAIGTALLAYAAAQGALFALVWLFAALPGVRMALTPASLKGAAARRAAMEQFLAKGLHLTEGRTGVLIFAALAERRVEVVADKGIYEKVDPKVWNQAVSALTAALRRGRAGDGFVEAIGLCGAVLAEHFPPVGDNPNELPDELIEI